MWSTFDVLLWLITPSVSELIMFMESTKNIFSRYQQYKNPNERGSVYFNEIIVGELGLHDDRL